MADAEEKYIQFIANYNDWVCIKKMKIIPETEPRAILEFLASLGTSFDKKVEQNLGRVVDIVKLNNALDSALMNISGKSADELGKVIAAVNGSAINSIIREIVSEKGFEKSVAKELEQFLKAYAIRRALKEAGLGVDYSEIDIPGMKRVKKAKV